MKNEKNNNWVITKDGIRVTMEEFLAMQKAERD